MIREKNHIRLSDIDEERFTIYDVPDQETLDLIANLRKTFILVEAVLGLILLGLIAALILFWHHTWGRLGLFTGAFVMLFVNVVNVNMYITNVRSFRSRSHYIMVEMMEKLPIETEVIDTPRKKKETFTFYPVRAKDTKKGNYVSTVYLKQSEYESFTPGEVKQIYVPVRRDRKK